ncbi:SxtJ family membrane protein [Magnetospirillum gryphiswaldense]|nr:SxtJ family membrane protein [Magnetospirillum gryphiswaldense]
MSSKSSPVLEAHGHSGPVQMGSERSFGIVFAVVFALIGLWPLKAGGDMRLWALGLAALFLVVAFVAPKLLKPLNLLWFKFGLLLHKIMTPLIMGLLFFLTVTPVGMLMRATGKDPMRLKRDPDAASYWIDRDPPGPKPASMKNQF